MTLPRRMNKAARGFAPRWVSDEGADLANPVAKLLWPSPRRDAGTDPGGR
jgi:hypothetical protein